MPAHARIHQRRFYAVRVEGLTIVVRIGGIYRLVRPEHKDVREELDRERVNRWLGKIWVLEGTKHRR